MPLKGRHAAGSREFVRRPNPTGERVKEGLLLLAAVAAFYLAACMLVPQ